MADGGRGPWLVPFGLGLLAGGLSRQRRRRTVNIVLKSGATVAGTFHHATASEFTLADATMKGVRYDLSLSTGATSSSSCAVGT